MHNLTAWRVAARRRMAGWSSFAEHAWSCDVSHRLGGSRDCLEM